MSLLDWSVLLSTLLFITIYGIFRSRGNKDIEGYLLGNKSIPWYSIGISIMATQASAITFLSAPGQAFTDGMRFVQFYFGLPVAMVVICVTLVPIFHRLKIYTAYEYLESRFDLKVRSLGALLFLIQRGLAAGLTIYAPSIILSAMLGWNIYWTNVFMGGIVVIYTVIGGTRAVAHTQMGQMAIMLGGMAVAGFLLYSMIPDSLTFSDVLHITGKTGKLNIIDFNFDPDNRYNVWSGLIGGFFLAMSYFGTDQSQVGRYISGKSVTEIRLGLLFNGIVKIPMQLCILFIGALLYVFYLFNPQPLFFNQVEVDKVREGKYAYSYKHLENIFSQNQEMKHDATLRLVDGLHSNDEVKIQQASEAIKMQQSVTEKLRFEAKNLISKNNPAADANDTNYIFLQFVISHMPEGIIGLLIAVIFAASMSSTSSELNALASTSIVDVYKRSMVKDRGPLHYLRASRWATVIWGIFAIGVAEFANRMGSLIEAVNILGSLFYGTILGIFLTGFYLKKVGSNAVFYSALFAEAVVIWCYNFTGISFLWYNLIGCLLVMGGSLGLQKFVTGDR